ncbi:sensor histidine kinase [Thomasclavelia sp.]
MIQNEFMFLKCRISMIFLLLFIYIFLPLRYKKSFTISILILSFILSGLIEYFQFIIFDSDNYSLIATFSCIIVVQGTNLLLSYYRDFRALFTGITAVAYVLVGNVVSLIFWVYNHNYFYACLIQSIIHIVLITLATVFLKKRYHFELENHKKGWSSLCLIPSLFYTIVYSLVVWPGDIKRTPKNSLAIIISLFITVVSYIILGRLFYQQRKNDILERNNEFLETYSINLRREIELTRAAEEKYAILRHDIRHTNNLIISYLKNNQIEQIYKLLNEVNNTLDETKAKIYCENIVLNSIISSSVLKAKENQIDFNITVDVPKSLDRINEFELATVLSNLLENAINATIKLPIDESKIWLKLYPIKNQLLLDISNTFDGNCKISPITGLPISKNGEGHGYGLRSVKAYAKKWDAIFEYSIEANTIFHLKILTVM